MTPIYLDALPLENVVVMIVVVFAKAVPLLVDISLELTVVEVEIVVICDEVVSLPWKLPKNETRVPLKASLGIFQ